MKLKIQNPNRSRQKGFAVLEAVAFLTIFIILTAYVVDFFASIHSGIVGSIASRAYLMETLQHRADIGWFRLENVPEPGKPGEVANNLRPLHARFSMTIEENSDYNNPRAPGRKLTQVSEDNQTRLTIGAPRGGRASTVIVRTGYGICIDAQCEDGG